MQVLQCTEELESRTRIEKALVSLVPFRVRIKRSGVGRKWKWMRMVNRVACSELDGDPS